MSVARRMQIPAGANVVVLGQPVDVDLEIAAESLVTSDPADATTADAVVCFVTRAADLDDVGGPVVEAARDDRLAWVVYPKARQLGSDLNRDILAQLLGERGLQPVRSISVSSVWSGLRFRPA